MNLQERESDIFITVDLILSFQQMWAQHPDVLYLYPDVSISIICGKHDLVMPDIIYN